MLEHTKYVFKILQTSAFQYEREVTKRAKLTAQLNAQATTEERGNGQYLHKVTVAREDPEIEPERSAKGKHQVRARGD